MRSAYILFEIKIMQFYIDKHKILNNMKLKAIFKILGYVIMMCVASCNYTNEVEDPGDNVVTSSKNTGTSSHYEAHNLNTKFHHNDSTPISIDSTHNYTVEIYKKAKQ